MNEKQLSARLIRVAEWIPNGMRVADIGSDHAYLPCFLVLRDETTTAIAGEVNEGPFQLAKSQVQRLGLSHKIDVRKGNGLEVLQKGEADVIAIAGMGGGLITTILDEGKEKLEGVTRLVLQPNVAARQIRIWLRQNGWRIHKEGILSEDEKIYEIIVAERGDDKDLYEEETEKKLLLGPYLMKEKNKIFYEKWQHEVSVWKRILSQLDEATENETSKQKRKILIEKIKMVEEVL